VPATGSSTGEVSLWLADPSAAAADGSGGSGDTERPPPLTRLGTALLPDQQAALVLDLIVVAAGSNGSSGSSGGWQLLLAAGKTLGKVAVWRSGVLTTCDPSTDAGADSSSSSSGRGLSRQQLAMAVSCGVGSSRQCHSMTGHVTGVVWNPWEQLLVSSGADGDMLTWTWGAQGLQVRGCFGGGLFWGGG
jgi:hypothetical protein